MSNTEQQHPFDEIAVYALDGLEPDEQAAVEAHLAGCLVCQAELDGHLATLARLTPDEPASPALWARISESIAAEAGGALEPPRLEAVPYPGAPPAAEPRRRPAGRRTPGAPGAGPRHLARRRRPWERVAGLAAAAAVVLVAALGIGYLLGDRGEEQPDIADVAQDAIDAGDPVATLATPDGAAVARVVVTNTGTGYFLADDLPTLEEGRTYQLWQLDGDQPISLGTVGDGTTPITSVAVPSGTTTMAVSAEVAGGAVSPTPDQIIASGEAT
ncbi:MAG TPA: anti-sigma factor [Acidimicrobiales bacterium]|nr:anti-sigma factor [Acidimicrobiales bacterium]